MLWFMVHDLLAQSVSFWKQSRLLYRYYCRVGKLDYGQLQCNK